MGVCRERTGCLESSYMVLSGLDWKTSWDKWGGCERTGWVAATKFGVVKRMEFVLKPAHVVCSNMK